jgi:hypothetical protein
MGLLNGILQHQALPKIYNNTVPPKNEMFGRASHQNDWQTQWSFRRVG